LKKLYFGVRQGIWTWPTVGAIFGLTGGVIATTFGAFLLTIETKACAARAGI
jgi:cobalamin synthase